MSTFWTVAGGDQGLKEIVNFRLFRCWWDLAPEYRLKMSKRTWRHIVKYEASQYIWYTYRPIRQGEECLEVYRILRKIRSVPNVGSLR